VARALLLRNGDHSNGTSSRRASRIARLMAPLTLRDFWFVGMLRTKISMMGRPNSTGFGASYKKRYDFLLTVGEKGDAVEDAGMCFDFSKARDHEGITNGRVRQHVLLQIALAHFNEFGLA
jgi:hypothetical protein